MVKLLIVFTVCIFACVHHHDIILDCIHMDLIVHRNFFFAAFAVVRTPFLFKNRAKAFPCVKNVAYCVTV